MNLLLKLRASPWFWADILLSISGGVIVYWGLSIEKKAEKMMPPADFRPDIFEDVVNLQKSELERGWRILMTGIVVEVVAALGISVISGLEIADLTDKAASAIERTALVESNNLVLRSKVVALEEKEAQRRTITTPQETNLINFLQPFSKANFKANNTVGKVRIIVSMLDSEAVGYAVRLGEVLGKCGFHTDISEIMNVNVGLSPQLNGVGMSISVNDSKNPILSGALLDAFRSFDIQPMIVKTNADDSSDVILEINVLHKQE